MQHAKKSIAIAAIISVAALATLLAVDKRPDSPGPGASSKELVEAARRAYELRIALRPTNPDLVTLDEIYIWSKRWMTAEWDLDLHAGQATKAVKFHFDRMIDLEAVATRLHQAKLATEADVAAATYYRIEAELMLARTGN